MTPSFAPSAALGPYPIRAACLISTLLFAGCLSPKVIDPRPPVSAPIAGMNVVDERAPFKTEVLRSPQPPLANRLGGWSILPDRRRVADLVASVVAVRFPGASVTLASFDADTDIGVFVDTSYCRFMVHITTAEGRTYTIRAEGRNPHALGGPENLKIAIERALAHFYADIQALPAAT